jgi:hypothetical protein
MDTQTLCWKCKDVVHIYNDSFKIPGDAHTGGSGSLMNRLDSWGAT